MITEYILLMVFMIFNMAGSFLILLRTGDYDTDMFTKILGWLLFIPSLIGLLKIYQWTGILLFIIGALIVIFIKYNLNKKKDKNESAH